jgi:hypothetical protein
MKKLFILLLAFSFSISTHAGIIKKRIPDRLVVLTFDDATASQYSIVAPMLVPSWAMNDRNKPIIMDAFGEAKDGKIVVLTIHGVHDAEHPWVNTPPELLMQHLQYLSDNHFKVISVRELAKYVDARKAAKMIVPDLNKSLRNSR